MSKSSVRVILKEVYLSIKPNIWEVISIFFAELIFLVKIFLKDKISKSKKFSKILMKKAKSHSYSKYKKKL